MNRRVLWGLILLICALLLATTLEAQVINPPAKRIKKGAALPATCNIADVFYLTAAPIGFNLCTAANTWTQITSTVGTGTSPIVAKVDTSTTQNANIGPTSLYVVPANKPGMYRFSCTINVTLIAGTSSTLPGCQVRWTDLDTNTAQAVSVTGTNSSNVLGTSGQVSGFQVGNGSINVKESTTIQYSTSGYASAGAPAMTYVLHIKLEYLGN